MAALVASVAILAPRAVAPKARASRTLRATTFSGVKVAQPKVRDLPDPCLSRKNTLGPRVPRFRQTQSCASGSPHRRRDERFPARREVS